MAEASTVGRALPSLTSLRAFAALLVLCYHGRSLLGDYAFRHGYVGVGFFFVLSGFVLAWTHPDRDTPAQFFRRRFARVYPLHVVVLFLVLWSPLGGGDRHVGLILPSLLLVQAWYPGAEVAGINSVAWSLSCEAFFYALFPLAWLALRRLRPSGEIALCVVGVVCTAGLAYACFLRSGSGSIDYAYHAPIARLVEFIAGVVLGRFARRGAIPEVGMTTAVLAVAIAYALSLPLAKASAVNLLMMPFFALLIAAAVGSDLKGRSRWLATPALQWLGEISFAFYLVHLVVLTHGPWTAFPAPLHFLVALAVTTAVAAALHHLVERPARELLRGQRKPVPIVGDAATNRA